MDPPLATSLTLKAYDLHQLTLNIMGPFHYVSWDTNTKKWKFESTHVRRIWPYYLFLALNLLVIIFYFPVLYTIYQQPSSARIYSPKSLFPCGMLVINFLLNLIVDYYFITSGEELVYISNFYNKTEPIENNKMPACSYWRHMKNFNIQTLRKSIQDLISGKFSGFKKAWLHTYFKVLQ